MNGNTIYHLEFKAGGHHYFGSISAIYETFDAKSLGIERDSLYSYVIRQEKPYKNKICIIRKGIIKRKKGNRKRP